MRIGAVEQALTKEIEGRRTICFSLLDSENIKTHNVGEIAKTLENAGISAILVGGSTIADQTELNTFVKKIKEETKIPVILFPGTITGVSPHADAILFTSLLNSDNPYFITGAQALGASAVRKHSIEALPTAYIIVGEGGSTGFIGQARGIPSSKPNLAAMYALAAQYMGMRFLYLESGSGASSPVPTELIIAVRKVYDGFLITGGGIKEPEAAKAIAKAGADAIVLGTLFESSTYKIILPKIMEAVRED